MNPTTQLLQFLQTRTSLHMPAEIVNAGTNQSFTPCVIVTTRDRMTIVPATLALDVRLISRFRVSDLEIMVLGVLKRLNVKIIIIDEVHNLLAGINAIQSEFLNLIRFLGN